MELCVAGLKVFMLLSPGALWLNPVVPHFLTAHPHMHATLPAACCNLQDLHEQKPFDYKSVSPLHPQLNGQLETTCLTPTSRWWHGLSTCNTYLAEGIALCLGYKVSVQRFKLMESNLNIGKLEADGF